MDNDNNNDNVISMVSSVEKDNINKIDGQSNIEDISPYDVLDAVSDLDDIQSVIVIATRTDGSVFANSSAAQPEKILWCLELTKASVLNGN